MCKAKSPSHFSDSKILYFYRSKNGKLEIALQTLRLNNVQNEERFAKNIFWISKLFLLLYWIFDYFDGWIIDLCRFVWR